jgi:hypothetical protein
MLRNLAMVTLLALAGCSAQDNPQQKTSPAPVVGPEAKTATQAVKAEAVLVLGSDGPSTKHFAEGQKIGRDLVVLGEGETLTVLVDGQTQTFKGPGRFVPGETHAAPTGTLALAKDALADANEDRDRTATVRREIKPGQQGRGSGLPDAVRPIQSVGMGRAVEIAPVVIRPPVDVSQTAQPVKITTPTLGRPMTRPVPVDLPPVVARAPEQLERKVEAAQPQ